MASAHTQSNRHSWGRRTRIAGRACAAGAVVTAVVISVGPQLSTVPTAVAAPAATKPTATVSGLGEPTRLLLYQQSMGPAYDNMQSALQTIDDSLRQGKWDDAIAGCQQLANSSAQFRELLPSPDAKLTSKVRAIADNLATAADLCMNFGPQTTNADYSHMRSYVTKAVDNLIAAKHVMSPGS